jgi:hypothetical protein
MHEIYRVLATDLQRERIHEADQWRRATEARASGSGRPSILARARGLLSLVVRQPAPTAVEASSSRFAADAPACCS